MSQQSSRTTVTQLKKYSNEWTLLHGAREGEEDCDRLVFAFWSDKKKEWPKHQDVRVVDASTTAEGRTYLKVRFHANTIV